MEGSNKVTKGQLLEMIRKEIIFQDKKELLENKISSINDELYVLTEGREGKKKKEDDIDEGLFQNIGRSIGKAFGGAQQVGTGIKQQYQAGADKKSLNYVISDISKKEAELADSKKQYQNLTGKAYNPKTASKATAAPRNQQGLVKKAPAKKATTATAKTNTPTQRGAAEPQSTVSAPGRGVTQAPSATGVQTAPQSKRKYNKKPQTNQIGKKIKSATATQANQAHNQAVAENKKK